MFSKELRKKIFKKFNIEESCLNRPIHYKIPDNVGINTYLIYNSLNEQKLNKKVKKISRNITNYSLNKGNNIRQLKNSVQRNKIDIIFNKTYDKLSNQFRNSEYYLDSNKKPETISNFRKEKIKDDITNKNNFYNSIFKKNYYRNNDNYFLDKQYTWSKTLLERRQIKKYKKIYKIQYIDTLPSFHKKIYENHKYQRDKSIPKIIKINSPNDNNSNKSTLFNKKKRIIENKKKSFSIKKRINFNTLFSYNYNNDILNLFNDKKNIQIY